jgi:hypothetical protein
MSLMNDPSIDGNNPEHQDSIEAAPSHAPDIASRHGLTREAALLEMEKFLGVSEYETRKLVGQRSVLRQPEAPVPNEPTHQKRTADRAEAPKIEQHEITPVVEVSAPEMPVEVQPFDQTQPALTES